MARLNLIATETSNDRAKELLNAVQAKLGLVPNMTRAMVNSTAVLDGYLHLSGALGKGRLPVKVREQIALAVSQENACDYCLAAHSTIGKMVGLTPDQIKDSRLGTAVDPKTEILLQFARKVNASRGHLSDQDIEAVREAGYDDGAIAEVVAHVALNVFTNYFNNVAETDIDFPKAEALSVVTR